MEIFKPTELNFSDKAIEHFQNTLSRRGNGIGVKIGVKKAGCSGYEYFFDFVDEINDGKEKDTIIKYKNCKFLVDSNSLTFLKGSLVDYSEEGFNKGIKFHNPNANATCGCGESFSMDSEEKNETKDSSLKKK